MKRPTTSWSNLFAAGVNPGALADEVRLRERTPLYKSDSPLSRINFLGLSEAIAVSPVLVRPGLIAEFQPLSVLFLHVGYDSTLYFGRGGARQSFPSVRSASKETLFGIPQGAHPDESSLLHRFTLGATLQAVVGKIAFRSANVLAHVQTQLGHGDRAYFDPAYDSMLAAKEWVFESNTDVLVLPTKRWAVGVRGSALISFAPGSAYAPGEPHVDPQARQYQLGPLGNYVIHPRASEDGAQVSLFGLATFHIHSRERDGDSTPAAIPFALVGALIDGIL